MLTFAHVTLWQFRAWKAFYYWKKMIRRHKSNKCRKVLQEELYILNPVLRGPLIELRKLCYDVRYGDMVISASHSSGSSHLCLSILFFRSKWALFKLEDRVTYSLDSFQLAQNEHLQQVAGDLQQLLGEVRDIVLKACDLDLRQFLVISGFRRTNDGKGAAVIVIIILICITR